MSDEKKSPTFVETVEVAGNQLVDKIKDLLQESTARRVVVRNQDGDELMTLPLTVGLVGGGIVALTSFWATAILAAVGTVSALTNKVRLDIERIESDDVAELGEEESGSQES